MWVSSRNACFFYCVTVVCLECIPTKDLAQPLKFTWVKEGWFLLQSLASELKGEKSSLGLDLSAIAVSKDIL